MEAGILERARAMLDRDPGGALRETNRHAAEHTHGQLAAEREMIAVDALRRLGRTTEARRRAQRLIDRSPSSIYTERARAILRELSEAP